MELRRGFQALRKWLWLIVLGTFLCAVISVWALSLAAPVYQASTSLLVTRGLVAGSDAGSISASQYLAVTYKELLTKRPVIEQAASNLGLDPVETEKLVQVQLIPDTALIVLTVEADDPNLAMEIANEIVNVFMSQDLAGIRIRELVVVEPASPPPEPSRATVIYGILGAFVGLLLASALAFSLEYLNEGLETDADVERILGLRAMAAIPRLGRRERSSKLVTTAHPDSLASETYRTLRTNVYLASIREAWKTLVISSAEPGAGTSTTVANLGVALAQLGVQVVLIDADLRLPTLHRLFDTLNRSGLTDLLTGRTRNLLDCITKTKIENLWLIPSGPIQPNPSELLGSKRMDAVLEQVKQSADLILIDAPSAPVLTDAAVLASKADNVLLVVAARQTSPETALRARATLDRAGAKLLGVALNGARVGLRARRAYARLLRRKRAIEMARHGKMDATPQVAEGAAAAQPSRSVLYLKKVQLRRFDGS